MKIILIGILVFFSFLICGLGESDPNKYTAIIQRNAFNLREPEPPKPPEPPPPSVSVKLTGITTLLNTKRVFLVIQEQGKQPESRMLQEGDKDGPVEVVEIDAENGKVKIINSGKEQILDFEKDGIKPPSAPPSVPTMPQPGTPVPGAIPLPGAVNPNAPKPVPPGSPTIPGTTTVPNTPGQPVIIMPNIQPTTINPSSLPGATQPQQPSAPSAPYSNPRPVRLPGSKL